MIKKSNSKNGKLLINLAILCCVLLRVVLAFVYKTQFDIFGYDMWLRDINEVGLLNMYNSSLLIETVDYPPVFPFLLWIVSKLIDVAKFNFAYKLIPVIADLGIIVFLYKEFGYKISLMWAINPAAIVNSSMWAQTDILFVLVVFLFLCALKKNNSIVTGVLLALSILVKPQGIYLIPVYFIYLITCNLNNRKRIMSLLSCAFVGIIVWLPFMIKFKGIMLPFSVYFGTSNMYSAYSINAANIWIIKGYEEYPGYYSFINYALLILCVCILVLAYRKTHNLILSTGIYLLFIFMITLSQHDRYPLYFLSVFLLVYAFNNIKSDLLIYLSGSIALGIYELFVLLIADNYIGDDISAVLFITSQMLDGIVNIGIFSFVIYMFFKGNNYKKYIE